MNNNKYKLYKINYYGKKNQKAGNPEITLPNKDAITSLLDPIANIQIENEGQKSIIPITKSDNEIELDDKSKRFLEFKNEYDKITYTNSLPFSNDLYVNIVNVIHKYIEDPNFNLDLFKKLKISYEEVKKEYNINSSLLLKQIDLDTDNLKNNPNIIRNAKDYLLDKTLLKNIKFYIFCVDKIDPNLNTKESNKIQWVGILFSINLKHLLNMDNKLDDPNIIQFLTMYFEKSGMLSNLINNLSKHKYDMLNMICKIPNLKFTTSEESSCKMENIILSYINDNKEKYPFNYDKNKQLHYINYHNLYLFYYDQTNFVGKPIEIHKYNCNWDKIM